MREQKPKGGCRISKIEHSRFASVSFLDNRSEDMIEDTIPRKHEWRGDVGKPRRKAAKVGALLSWLWLQENFIAGYLVTGEGLREACGSIEPD